MFCFLAQINPNCPLKGKPKEFHGTFTLKGLSQIFDICGDTFKEKTTKAVDLNLETSNGVGSVTMPENFLCVLVMWMLKTNMTSCCISLCSPSMQTTSRFLREAHLLSQGGGPPQGGQLWF